METLYIQVRGALAYLSPQFYHLPMLLVRVISIQHCYITIYLIMTPFKVVIQFILISEQNGHQ